MTENQFKFDRNTVATNLKTPIVYDEERMSIGEVLSKLNEFYEENKELKYKLRNCKDARKSYKQDWKACVSYCDEYKNKIISLKDEIEQLKQHNTELVNKIDFLERIIDGDV